MYIIFEDDKIAFLDGNDCKCILEDDSILDCCDGLLDGTMLEGDGLLDGTILEGDGLLDGTILEGDGLLDGTILEGDGLLDGTILEGDGLLRSSDCILDVIEGNDVDVEIRKVDCFLFDSLQKTQHHSYVHSICHCWLTLLNKIMFHFYL